MSIVSKSTHCNEVKMRIDFSSMNKDYTIEVDNYIYQLDKRSTNVWDIYKHLGINVEVTAVLSEKGKKKNKILIVPHFANNELFAALHWAIAFRKVEVTLK